MLVDSHCHLDYLERDGDLDEVVGRARRAGVGVMVTICTKLSEFDRVRAIAERYDEVYCSVGVHPHEAEDEGQKDARRLVELAGHPKVVGIGETGPDDDTVALLREAREEGPFTGVIHCFTAGPGLAQAALELGLYISVAGIVTFKKAEDLRRTLGEVPLDRLLVETDAPYLAPVPKRGKRNEPAYVIHTAAALAELKGVAPEVLVRATGDNVFRLFAKAVRPAPPPDPVWQSLT